ncbi:MAG: HIT domain-containing protein [Ignavibacteriales bacterium]|nr:HIT domain-containing protein [Ignavibacteriales bacterium]
MERLFSPWRSKYIESFSSKSDETVECVLCSARQANNDEQRLIVYRGTHSFAIMNLYPYNSGHLMIVPNRHIPSITDLSDEETLEIMNITKLLIKALQYIMKPDGFNYGLNSGRSAGAGIEKHIHFHLVPRWHGDTNFMPILSDTKIVSEDLRDTWFKLTSYLKSF